MGRKESENPQKLGRSAFRRKRRRDREDETPRKAAIADTDGVRNYF